MSENALTDEMCNILINFEHIITEVLSEVQRQRLSMKATARGTITK